MMGRAAVARWLGQPEEQVGSVNEPRSHEEFGVRWNEKWLYAARRVGAPRRVALFLRYDLVGVFVVSADGSYRAEPPSAARA